MIAVDTSALVAIVRAEPEQGVFAALMSEHGAALGAPSLLEAKMVLAANGAEVVDALFERFVHGGRLAIVDFTPEMADVAAGAFRRYGKGRGNPAQLNFGDCLSYAVAKVRGVPLLFKGDDFVHTDIEPAWRP